MTLTTHFFPKSTHKTLMKIVLYFFNSSKSFAACFWSVKRVCAAEFSSWKLKTFHSVKSERVKITFRIYNEDMTVNVEMYQLKLWRMKWGSTAFRCCCYGAAKDEVFLGKLKQHKKVFESFPSDVRRRRDVSYSVKKEQSLWNRMRRKSMSYSTA